MDITLNPYHYALGLDCNYDRRHRHILKIAWYAARLRWRPPLIFEHGLKNDN